MSVHNIYTESEQVYEFYVAVPPGITHSPYGCLRHKQLYFRKPARNEYISHKNLPLITRIFAENILRFSAKSMPDGKAGAGNNDFKDSH